MNGELSMPPDTELSRSEVTFCQVQRELGLRSMGGISPTLKSICLRPCKAVILLSDSLKSRSSSESVMFGIRLTDSERESEEATKLLRFTNLVCSGVAQVPVTYHLAARLLFIEI